MPITPPTGPTFPSNLVQSMQALAGNLNLSIGVPLGINEHTVRVRLPMARTTSAITGISSDVGREEFTTFPTALVKAFKLNETTIQFMQAGGILQVGDIEISQIPRNPTNDAIVRNPKSIWLISGPLFNQETTFNLIDGTAHFDLLEAKLVVRRAGR